MRLIFIGDSITDAGRDRTDPSSLGDGYVSMLASELTDGGAEVINLGIAGNRAADLAARWDSELLPAAPDVLTVYIGVNEVWRRFDSDDPTPTEEFESTMRGLLASAIQACSPQLILMEPYLLPVSDEQRAWLPELDEKRAAVARVATEFSAQLVPLHDVLTEAARGRDAAEFAPDGVHPLPAGSRAIAGAWREAYRALAISDSR